MRYAVLQDGESRSFPSGDPFVSGGGRADIADVLLHLGVAYREDLNKAAVLIELGTECLARHVGAGLDDGATNVLGFARYRNGSDAPSNLVEIVRPRGASDTAVTAARMVFEEAGLQVALCSDEPGRIIDRLVRPKYNAALRLFDEGLATQTDMDLTCRLGLGYPDGPIERVFRGGLASHYSISAALHEAYGSIGYVPARLALVAAQREALL